MLTNVAVALCLVLGSGTAAVAIQQTQTEGPPQPAASQRAAKALEVDRNRSAERADRSKQRAIVAKPTTNSKKVRVKKKVVKKKSVQYKSIAPSTGSNRRIGKALAAKRGWTGQQWTCLNNLWTKESGWSTGPSKWTNAYGIPQSLPGSKMASAGSDWRTNPVTQITWGLGYIKSRYGSPCKAWAHWQARNWY